MRALLLTLLLLGTLAQAHGGHLELENARILVRDTEAFLEARLVYGEEEPLALTAVVLQGVEGVLEERQTQGYAPLSRIEIQPGTLEFGPETPVRVRFEIAGLELKGPTVPVTLLITPGGLVTQAVPLDTGTASVRPSLGVLLAVLLALWVLLGRYRRAKPQRP
ncbi:hypothetical protein [Marinithermus hydrothermalis]|uniref:LPXTG-motif cell wall anchor domain protein n=1 Tax=Marinithermus hydrothermalis (strain DSM 14884 / JCM 11576 / T1) TaxID=869210 RepID=F2NLB3_MARHT|nr:hypothetical protein [Marinithermus hydrothermalis]AEB11732.1 hypothetical protein Marky_0989 [Marinithermus hydrothermalis DSM 14884]